VRTFGPSTQLGHFFEGEFQNEETFASGRHSNHGFRFPMFGTGSPTITVAQTSGTARYQSTATETTFGNGDQLWDAWKNKDAKPFEMHLASDGVMVGEEGIGSKNDVVKMMANMPCEVKSFTLTDWKLSRINANTALLTYKGAADGTCMGTAIPTTWSKGTWQALFHQETPVK
jgi:hypothetical protein